MSNELQNYMQILEEGLDKKILVLSELVSLTDEQNSMLKAEEFLEDTFHGIVMRKGELIEELVRLDDGFQSLYDRIKENLELQRSAYKKEITDLQTKIRMVVDQSMMLERKERANEPLVSRKFASLRKEANQVHRSRDLATNYYKSMNRISDEPSFMDTKK